MPEIYPDSVQFSTDFPCSNKISGRVRAEAVGMSASSTRQRIFCCQRFAFWVTQDYTKVRG